MGIPAYIQLYHTNVLFLSEEMELVEFKFINAPKSPRPSAFVSCSRVMFTNFSLCHLHGTLQSCHWCLGED